MLRCLELARQGGREVGLNPLVGAVLVRSGQVIAEGYHHGFGKPHAEADLLQNFNQPGLPTDVLYVNLEPCSHAGKTPPCTALILEQGIGQVVFGMRDPNPAVTGLEALQAAGVQVVGPLLEPACKRLNRGFVSVQSRQRPFITLKKAQTKTGQIAKSDGSPLAITNSTQNQWSHLNLRAQHDAILVGVQTVINDDPQLTTRLNSAPDFNLDNYRIVLDPTLRIPLTAKIVTGELAQKTIIVTAAGHTNPKLTDRGVRIWPVETNKTGLDLNQLWQHCLTPVADFHGIASILVEGGANTWARFKDGGWVDEEVTLTEYPSIGVSE